MSPRFLGPRFLCGWLAVGIAVLLALSFVPLAWKPQWGLHGEQHFRVHAAAFAVMGTVASLTAISFHERQIRWLILIVIAVESELLQSKFFAIPLEWSDLEADGLGLLIALLAFRLLRQCGPSSIPFRRFLQKLKVSLRGNAAPERTRRISRWKRVSSSRLTHYYFPHHK